MVCGFRYNARLLARHIAETLFGRARERPRSIRSASCRSSSRAGDGPELAMQKGYLARVVRADGDGLDDGILPLEVFVDGEYDGVAATLEFDDEERIRPVLYVRSGGGSERRCCRRTRCAATTGRSTARRSPRRWPRSCPSSSCLLRPCLGSDPGHGRTSRCSGQLSRLVPGFASPADLRGCGTIVTPSAQISRLLRTWLGSAPAM